MRSATSLPAIGLFEAVSQLGLTALLGVLYARRAHTLAAAGRPVKRARQLAFYSGLTVIAATLLALDHLAEVSLTWHMGEHLLVSEIGSLLIVLGLTGPLIAPVLRAPLLDRLRVLSNPLLAFPLWAADLYLWHLPALYESALHSTPVHALEHLCFIGFGVNMWMCLFGPLPMPRWFGNAGKLGYILAVRLTGTVLANIFLWSGTVFYPFYIHPDIVRHISPLVDQNVAGAVMMVESSVLTICLFCWLFMRTMRESEERQELVELARGRGLALSEERAGRAVSAGRAPLLRHRIEEGAEGAGATASWLSEV
ncbi:MAG: cytochrome c oxidase assembly protein [Acidobacteriota bacterium]|nr:cytochrome c oxidase assembly protein [Acidobacteriota bacterium]